MSRCYERLQDDERDVREVTEDRVLRWTPDDEVRQGEAPTSRLVVRDWV